MLFGIVAYRLVELRMESQFVRTKSLLPNILSYGVIFVYGNGVSHDVI